MFLHTKDENMEASIYRVGCYVFAICLLCVDVSDKVDDVSRHLIHVENRRQGVQTNRVKLVCLPHRDFGEFVEILGYHRSFKLSNVLDR